MLSLEAQGRDRKGLDRSLQKRVNGFAGLGQIDRSIRHRAAVADAVEDAHAASARERAAASGSARPRAPGSLRHCTTCAHCRRHSTKRSWRRASSSKLCAMTTSEPARIDPARERVDHRPLVERPVGEIRIDEDDLARAVLLGARERASRTASRNSAREAIGDDVVGGHVVSSSKSSGFGHAPAGAQPFGQQVAAPRRSRRRRSWRRAGAGRRAGASVSHRGRRRGTTRR